MSSYIAWSPLPDGTAASDKAGGGISNSNVIGHGWDLVVQYDNPLGMVEGLNLFGGYSWIDQVGDAREQHAYGATYAVGGVTLGYQHSQDSNPKVHNIIDSYDNDAYVISFAVNDDLSVSYGEHTSTAEKNGIADVEMTSQSVQIAYTVGGAAIKIAEADIENKLYGTADINATTIAVTLAF
jgi:hypothetical protein